MIIVLRVERTNMLLHTFKLEAHAINLSSGAGGHVIFGSKGTGHTRPLEERSSRGFLLSLELTGKRAFLREQ